jgi:hypothetical protein
LKLWNKDGVLPLLAVLVIIGVVLVMGMMIVAFLTLKMLLVLLLGGSGLYLFIRPDRLTGLPAWAKMGVPLILMAMAILVYTEVLEIG